MTTRVHTLLLLLALLATPAAHAQELSPSAFTGASSGSFLLPGGTGSLLGGYREPNRFTSIRGELHLDFLYYGAVGAGGRVEFPVAPYGLLDGVNDELALSFGAEVFFFYDPRFQGWGVDPIASVQWNFYLGMVSLFPELGVAFIFGPNRDAYWVSFAAPYLGLGLRVHFNARNALLFRASWPAGLQVGITF